MVSSIVDRTARRLFGLLMRGSFSLWYNYHWDILLWDNLLWDNIL